MRGDVRGRVDTAEGAAGEVIVANSVVDLGRPAWERLLAASQAPVFYSWDFMRSIEERPLTSGARMYYVSIRQGGEVTAALPFSLQETVDPFSTGPTAPKRMLGSHVWHCYDTRMLSLHPVGPSVVGVLQEAAVGLGCELGASSGGLYNVDLDGAELLSRPVDGFPGSFLPPRINERMRT